MAVGSVIKLHFYTKTMDFMPAVTVGPEGALRVVSRGHERHDEMKNHLNQCFNYLQAQFFIVFSN